jgi:anaerobic selenocysteine-containing dehydrogenase
MEQSLAVGRERRENSDERVVVSICGVCPAGCGVEVHLRNDHIERLSPLRDHPQGSVCPRGMAAKEIVYSKDRLLYPQKKVGKRGEGNFKRISWDEAYDFIIDKLHDIADQYGPEAVAVYTGRGNFEFGLNESFAPRGPVESSANAVLFPFGSPNTTGVGSLCYVSYGMVASRACFGDYLRNMHEDIENSDLILIWGENPATDSPPINMRRIKTAQKRGARVIVIDHRRSESALALRAEWIGVRPGTDGALALSALQVLIQEDLYDHWFVENWAYGFDDLSAYVQNFYPERVEKITGVPAAQIRELARAIGKSHGCSILTYTGLEYSNSGLQAIRAVWTLQALAGHLDTPGGKLFKMRSRLQLNRLATRPPTDAPKPVGADDYPLYYEVRNEAHAALLPRAVLENKPYPVRGLLVSGASIITAWPNPDLWRKTLSSLDLLVAINRFPTADALYADILLPATTMFEIESYMIYDGYVQLRQRVIPPVGEARNDYLIFAELARRLGYGHLWPQTEEELVRHALRDTDINIEELRAHPEGIPFQVPEMHYRKYITGELRADEKPGFETPTGKFEIASNWLKAHGYEALPEYTEPIEGPLASPEVAEHYPLVFNSGARTQFAFRSQHLNIPSLVAHQPWPLVHIHPDDARARGIADGDKVFVVSPRGRVAFRAHVTDNIVRGAVEANMGGGGPIGEPDWQVSNVNELTDFENREPILGFPVYKALLCNVVKAQLRSSLERHPDTM